MMVNAGPGWVALKINTLPRSRRELAANRFPGSADTAYYNFVDRFDMRGMGKSVALATGNGTEALLALIDGKFMTFRVPYPMGFYAKGIDGRIDDAQIFEHARGLRALAGANEVRHRDGGQQGDDGNNHHNFDESEGRF